MVVSQRLRLPWDTWFAYFESLSQGWALAWFRVAVLTTLCPMSWKGKKIWSLCELVPQAQKNVCFLSLETSKSQQTQCSLQASGTVQFQIQCCHFLWIAQCNCSFLLSVYRPTVKGLVIFEHSFCLMNLFTLHSQTVHHFIWQVWIVL